MTRPAFCDPVRREWSCTYCGRRLGARSYGDAVRFHEGWTREGEPLVYRRPHHVGTKQPVTGRDRLVPTHVTPTPVTVVCRNRDCGEEIIVG